MNPLTRVLAPVMSVLAVAEKSMPLPNILLCTLMVLRTLKRLRILTRRWDITFRREYFGGA